MQSHFAQSGLTALMLASRHGHSDIAKTLLDHGAIVDYQEKVKDLE